ncbi:hypothetical protein MUK42_33634 [Musa troglodytarum]|uniref:Uncharacterized protein n=1 Tax=Musa troglodytarum TaxID=320322 RepID=A0A9E7EB84_9LILI|nr:hypothetical protein MUK42_33634 [Musa troglodytarum]
MGSETRMVDLLAEIPLEEEDDFLLTQETDSGITVGLVLVDFINGFCTVGAGNLEAARLEKLYCKMTWPVSHSSTPTTPTSPSFLIHLTAY